MHEGGLCEGVLAVVLDAAGERPVKRVKLRIGQLQRVVADSFDFYWQMVSVDTPAEGSSVDITEAPIRIRCRACNSEQTLPEPTFLCRACGSAEVDLIAGDRVAVESVELAGGEILRNPEFADVHEDEHEHSHT